MKVVIRAGGVGTRLWPYSRQGRPKQFHSMVGDRTMIQEAVDRILPTFKLDDVYVSTGESYAILVREQIPDLPVDHLIIEPALRNTGPAIGLECALLEARFPGCTIASLGSDHHVGKPEEFRRLLQVARAALDEMPEYLFTIGVRPSRVETGYGHIQKGTVLRKVDGEPVYAVKQFVEKPDEPRARKFTESGNYLWNSNIFVWKAATVLSLFARLEPDMHAILMRIKEAVGTPGERRIIEGEYPKLRSIPIDYAIIERAEFVATLQADIDWSDIGSWSAIGDVIPSDSEGNLFSGLVLPLDVRNVTAYGPSHKLIALVGVEDLVIVDTPDALLVARREKAQRVREIVDRLSQEDGLRKFV